VYKIKGMGARWGELYKQIINCFNKAIQFSTSLQEAIPAIGREGWNVLAMLQTSLYLLCVPSCVVDYQLSTHPLLPRYTMQQWAG
jgi:hypothetical protein